MSTNTERERERKLECVKDEEKHHQSRLRVIRRKSLTGHQQLYLMSEHKGRDARNKQRESEGRESGVKCWQIDRDRERFSVCGCVMIRQIGSWERRRNWWCHWQRNDFLKHAKFRITMCSTNASLSTLVSSIEKSFHPKDRNSPKRYELYLQRQPLPCVNWEHRLFPEIVDLMFEGLWWLSTLLACQLHAVKKNRKKGKNWTLCDTYQAFNESLIKNW